MSGFFSGAESALFSLPEAKVRSLLEQKRRRAKVLAKIKSKPQRLLITILIVNNLINIGASSLATVLAINRFGSAGAGIATGIMTFLILFFGEIVPKSIAQRYAVSIGLFIAPIMRVVMLVIMPLVWFLNALTIGFQKTFGIKDTPLTVSEDDVRAMVNLGHEEGQVESDEREMIENVFQLNDMTAEDIMTPEEFVVSFDSDTTMREAIPVIDQSGYSRFPVTNGNGDIDGVLYIKDVFRYVADHDVMTRSPHHKEILDMPVSKMMKDALFVPETRRLDKLLLDFQKKRMHIGIVVDEHGTARGLVTLEDLLEEIVGEIMDESDVDSDMIDRIDAQTTMLDPRVSISIVNGLVNMQLHGSKQKSIGWLVLKEFGHIPKKGDSVTIQGYKFIVDEADDRRIKRLKMIKTARAKSTRKK